MARIRNAYEVELPGARKVVMAELGSGDVRQCMVLAGNQRVQAAQEFDTALEGLRMSLRQVDGKAVTRDDIEGRLLDDLFSMSEIMLLVDVWRQIHMPNVGQVEAVRGHLKAISLASGG
jgi:hypothetical protein